MNRKVRDGLNGFSKMIGYSISATINSCISMMRMVVLSSIKVALKSRNYPKLKQHDTCCVLGNGPSLKAALTANEVRLDDVDVFAVNMFCVSEYFTQIKPGFYFLVDGAYFNPTDDRNKELVRQLTEKLNAVNWPMYLVVSSSCVKGGLLKTLDNRNVTVIKMNSTSVDGFKWFRHFVYHIRMGMPICQTVVNFALSTAVAMHYRQVLLYGADHTWTRDLFVDEENVVCYGDRHVYNTNLTIIKHTRTMTQILSDFSKMFAAHDTIREYADAEHVQILNATKGSFVDAYERLKQ